MASPIQMQGKTLGSCIWLALGPIEALFYKRFRHLKGFTAILKFLFWDAHSGSY